MVLKRRWQILCYYQGRTGMDAATANEAQTAFYSRIYERNSRYTENQTVAKTEMEEIYEQYGRYLIETKNSVLIEYLEKEIAKKEQIAADLKQSIKNMEDIEEVEELSGKDKANIVKRQRRYQELQKEIEDMRKAIF